jgi:multiple sugar transport system substrate-binding protein
MTAARLASRPCRRTRKLRWLQYIGQPAVQAEWAVAASRIVQTATFDDPQVQEQNQRVDNYYTLMRE